MSTAGAPEPCDPTVGILTHTATTITTGRDLTRNDIVGLLGKVGQELQGRELTASIYVAGLATMALTRTRVRHPSRRGSPQGTQTGWTASSSCGGAES